MNEPAILLQAASLLLRYPDASAYRNHAEVALALRALPPGMARTELLSFLDGAPDRQQLEEHYVAVLDRRRRCCLYMTWWTEGETRRRGLALAELKGNYRAHGWELDSGELPDFLPVLLEFAARTPADVGLALLRRYRAGIELLLQALVDQESPYAHVVTAVTAALGKPNSAEAAAALAMARTGPPVEFVGMPTTRDLGPTSLLPTHLASAR